MRDVLIGCFAGLVFSIVMMAAWNQGAHAAPIVYARR
jgi:hypothetical protein